MKKVVNMYLIFIGVFVFSLSTVYAFTFTRPLRLGSEGQDVLELQKILNSNPQTQISTEGAGSPGNETIYFGQKTLAAVKKFQNLHKKDVLEPVGLSEGTGYVGQSTLSFLNTKYAEPTGSASPTTQTPTTTQEKLFDFGQVVDSVGGYVGNFQGLGAASEKPGLFYPQVFASHAGKWEQQGRQNVFVDKPIRVGAGFNMKEVKFYLDDIQLTVKDCLSDYVCNVYLPHEKDKNPGTYKLRTSNPEYGYHDFKIVSINVPYPHVSTEIVKLGKDTVITGDNFTDDMRVFTPFGIYKTDSLDNSFILNIDSSSTYMRDLESETTHKARCATEKTAGCDGFEATKGALYVENKHGLRSNMKFVTYEK